MKGWPGVVRGGGGGRGLEVGGSVWRGALGRMFGPARQIRFRSLGRAGRLSVVIGCDVIMVIVAGAR